MNGNDRVDVYSLRGRWRRMFMVFSNVRKTHAMARGAGRGQLHNPYGIVRTSNGLFNVADLNNGRVNRYTARGRSRGQIGSFGTGPGRFLAPYGVAADGAGNLYVSDRDLNRVQKFSPAGGLLAAWGETGSARGDFLSPQGLAVDRAGNLYVADTNNARIQKLAPDGGCSRPSERACSSSRSTSRWTARAPSTWRTTAAWSRSPTPRAADAGTAAPERVPP